jgi:hypothetical protein
MSLNDRLNSALSKNRLLPVIREDNIPKIIAESPKPPKIVDKPTIYKTLEEGLKSARKHKPDEFGTTVIVVETIGDKIQLPMRVGNWLVQDAQKRNDGRYEVHLASGQG